MLRFRLALEPKVVYQTLLTLISSSLARSLKFTLPSTINPSCPFPNFQAYWVISLSLPKYVFHSSRVFIPLVLSPTLTHLHAYTNSPPPPRPFSTCVSHSHIPHADTHTLILSLTHSLTHTVSHENPLFFTSTPIPSLVSLLLLHQSSTGVVGASDPLLGSQGFHTNFSFLAS